MLILLASLAGLTNATMDSSMVESVFDGGEISDAFSPAPVVVSSYSFMWDKVIFMLQSNPLRATES